MTNVSVSDLLLPREAKMAKTVNVCATCVSWRLYAKTEGESRFSPLDFNAGTQVVNLIYATIFSEAEKARVVKSDFFDNNSDISFQWRKV